MDLIKDARKKAGMTQNELAEKLGVNRATLSKYENGQIDPTVSQLMKISEILGIPPYQLMGYSLKHDTPENRRSSERGRYSFTPRREKAARGAGNALRRQ